MSTIEIRFYAGLNQFLPPEKRQRSLEYPINEPVSVKHNIEAAGIPHTEIEVIIINGRPVTFDYLLQPGDRVAVFPNFTTINIDDLPLLRPLLPKPPRFVAEDRHRDAGAGALKFLTTKTAFF